MGGGRRGNRGRQRDLVSFYRQQRSRSASPIVPIGAGALPPLATLRAPEHAAPPALLDLSDRFPTKTRIAVDRLSGLAGRVLGGCDADVIWEWLRDNKGALQGVRRAVLSDCGRYAVVPDNIIHILCELLEPPFDSLRKRAESLRTLTDDKLILWDAAPAASREWVEVVVLDAIRVLAKAHCELAMDHIAATDPQTATACALCERDVYSDGVRPTPLPVPRRRGSPFGWAV